MYAVVNLHYRILAVTKQVKENKIILTKQKENPQSTLSPPTKPNWSAGTYSVPSHCGGAAPMTVNIYAYIVGFLIKPAVSIFDIFQK